MAKAFLAPVAAAFWSVLVSIPMTSSWRPPSTPPFSLISLAFNFAPFKAGASMEDIPPVKLYSAPSLMGSAAVPAMAKQPTTATTRKSIRILRFMFDLLSRF